MIKKNIYIISAEPQTIRFYERYCIEHLIFSGYSVIFLDLSSVFGKYVPNTEEVVKSVHIDSFESFDFYFGSNNLEEELVLWHLGSVSTSTLIFYDYLVKK